MRTQVLLTYRDALLDSTMYLDTTFSLPDGVLIPGTYPLRQTVYLVLKSGTIGGNQFQINRLDIPHRVNRTILKRNTTIFKAAYDMKQSLNILNMSEQPGTSSISFLMISLNTGNINDI